MRQVYSPLPGTFTFTVLTLAAVLMNTPSTAQFGDLDDSFSSDGKVTYGSNGFNERGYAATLRSEDGTIWAVGTSYGSVLGIPSRLVKISDAGAVMNTTQVNAGGTGSETKLYAVKELQNGRMITAGEVISGSSFDFAVCSFTSGLNPDLLFGIGGTGCVTTTIGSGNSKAWDVAELSGGDLVVAGYYESTDGLLYTALAKYYSSGFLDSDFGNDGITLDAWIMNEETFAHAVAVQPNGRIVVAGTTVAANGSAAIAITRFYPDGSLDPTFSGGGRVAVYMNGGTLNNGWDVALQPDGKILVCGFAEIDGVQQPALLRLNADGQNDTGFGGGDGHVVVSAPGGSGGYYSVALQPDGKIICAGYNVAGTEDFLISRFLPNGQLDQAWGWNGHVIGQFSSADERARSIEFLPDNKLLVGGHATIDGDLRFAVARYLVNDIVGVLELGIADQGVLVYPNPIRDETVFTYTLGKQELLTVQLQDLQGRTLSTFLNDKNMPAGEHTQAISLPAGLAAGNYLLVFSSPNGRMSIQLTK